MSKVFVCPKPDTWNRVYEALLKVWKSSGQKIPKPPIPLILGGWWASSDLQKHDRWKDTIKWAENNKCIELVPELTEGERYEVDEMTIAVEPRWNDTSGDDRE